MNWLTHIFFSNTGDESMLGNFLGDFICGINWKAKYNENIKMGIINHFKLDEIGTGHSVFKKSCDRIIGENSKYNLLLIDIFYDHFLALDWEKYMDTQLEEFIDSFYKVLYKYKAILPGRLKEIMPKMIKENWLFEYRKPEGIQAALCRLSKQMTMQNNIGKCMIEFEKYFDALKTDCRDFIFEMRQIFTSRATKNGPLIFANTESCL